MASQATGNSSAKVRRWYAPSVVKFLMATLTLQAALYLSAHFLWFWFNDHKGFTVLIAVAATTALLLLVLVWVMASRLFGAKTQFGLATLLLMVAVVGIPCGWLAREIELARRQRAALESLRADKAELYRRQTGIAMELEPAPSPVLGWLRKKLGAEFFEEKTSLRLADATDVDLAKLADLTELKVLSINDSITDQGMAHLQGCAQLRRLELRSPDITKEGWSQLQGIPRLRELDLIRATVGDAELEQIGKLSRLEVLRVTASRVSDDGLKHLQNLPKLGRVVFVNNETTDVGLERLSELGQLRSLSLAGNRVTDAGLEHLKRQTRLESISLNETWISKEGIKALKRALPNCEIQSDPFMTSERLQD